MVQFENKKKLARLLKPRQFILIENFTRDSWWWRCRSCRPAWSRNPRKWTSSAATREPGARRGSAAPRRTALRYWSCWTRRNNPNSRFGRYLRDDMSRFKYYFHEGRKRARKYMTCGHVEKNSATILQTKHRAHYVIMALSIPTSLNPLYDDRNAVWGTCVKLCTTMSLWVRVSLGIRRIRFAILSPKKPSLL